MLHFFLRVNPAKTLRVTASVSKKIAKKAVERNLIKRRVRAAARPLLLGLRPALYLVIARPGALAIKGEPLREELALLFKKG